MFVAFSNLCLSVGGLNGWKCLEIWLLQGDDCAQWSQEVESRSLAIGQFKILAEGVCNLGRWGTVGQRIMVSFFYFKDLFVIMIGEREGSY